MPRQFFTRISKEFRQKQDHPWYMKPFEFVLTHPVYFSTSRRGIGGGLWVGLFIGLIPVPAHTLLAAIGALLLRVNVPVAIAATWVTNPFTFVPIYYFGYQIGAALLNVPPEVMPDTFSFDWVLEEIDQHWKPLMLGTGIMALSVASTVYLIISVVWHVTTLRRYRSRHQRSVGSIKGGKGPQQKQSD
jgi:uncharacterized protein